jgi:nickel/cobalt transporter (NicO) family protein
MHIYAHTERGPHCTHTERKADVAHTEGERAKEIKVAQTPTDRGARVEHPHSHTHRERYANEAKTHIPVHTHTHPHTHPHPHPRTHTPTHPHTLMHTHTWQTSASCGRALETITPVRASRTVRTPLADPTAT